MAKRRMFSKDVIDTDHFLEMPMTAQVLYFHLALRADDDGFVSSPKRILRLIGAGEDDMKVLIAKSFIIPFDVGICVIRHWKIHNYIQKDRYSPTVYQDQFKLLKENSNKTYDLDTECIQIGNNLDAQVRLGKVRLGKDSLERESTPLELQSNSNVTESNGAKIDYQSFLDHYNENCTSLPRAIKVNDKRKGLIKAAVGEYGEEAVKETLSKVEEYPFLTGENDRGWKADFEWLMNRNNLLKVMEGRYERKPQKHKGSREGYDLNLDGYKRL